MRRCEADLRYAFSPTLSVGSSWSSSVCFTGACALVEEACGYGDQIDGRKAASKTYVDALHQRIRALEGMLEEAGLPHGGEVEERPAKGKEKAVDGLQGSDVEAGLEAIEMLKVRR